MIRLAVGANASGDVMHVENDAQRLAAVDAAIKGRSFVLTFDNTTLAAEVYDEIRRVAPVRIVSQDVLDQQQRRLLHIIGDGETVAAAAAAVGVSLRTAHRLLGAARASLDAPTNLAAIAILRATADPPRH